MNKIIAILILFIFMITGSSATEFAPEPMFEDKPVRIALVYSQDYKAFVRKGVDEFWEEGINDFIHKQVTISKTFFLNANSRNANEDYFDGVIDKIAERVKTYNPNYIVFMGNAAHKVYKEHLTSFKSAVVCLTDLNKDAIKHATENTDFITVHQHGIHTFLNYIHKNGAATPNFYVIRDVTAKSYRVYSKLREILFSHNQFFKVHSIEVSSMQDLRKELTELYKKPQGVIIPIFTMLPDYDTNKFVEWDAIITFIVQNNYRNIELILNDDGSDLGAAVSLSANHKSCKRPEVRDINYIEAFFDNPNLVVVYHETPALIVKKNRIIQLHAYELLKDLSDVDCLVGE